MKNFVTIGNYTIDFNSIAYVKKDQKYVDIYLNGLENPLTLRGEESETFLDLLMDKRDLDDL